MPRLLHLTLFATALFSALAQATSPLRETTTPVQIATATKISDEQLAQDWKLTPEEWIRYRQLMQGPLGTYSPNLDPLTALGIEAQSDTERQKYAELQVEAEALRVTKLLDYQRAYDEAWARRFPGQLRVYLPDNDSAAPQASGRLAVFVKLECRRCEQRVKQLLKSNLPFDLYLVNSRLDDELIRQWAATVGIEPAKVRDRRITLNHDSGFWQSLELSGDLPAVLREVNGQWLRQ